MNTPAQLPAGVRIFGELPPAYADICSARALGFLGKLARMFEPRQRELLARRAERQAEFDSGKLPDFSPDTKALRQSDWNVASVPADLQDRRVEITGPTDRKIA